MARHGHHLVAELLGLEDSCLGVAEELPVGVGVAGLDNAHAPPLHLLEPLEVCHHPLQTAADEGGVVVDLGIAHL